MVTDVWEGGTGRPNIAVAKLEAVDGRVVLVNADRAVSRHRWMSPRDQVLRSNPGQSCSASAVSIAAPSCLCM